MMAISSSLPSPLSKLRPTSTKKPLNNETQSLRADKINIERAHEAIGSLRGVRGLGTDKTSNDVVVISISGATSSGKTTLALILAEIFTTSDMASPLSLGTLPSSPQTLPAKLIHNSTTPRNLLIHQDLFFFNKGAAECVTFRSRHADLPFMYATLQNDEIGEYIFSKDPKRKDRWSVSGPDTDQLSAVNMWGMLKAVQFARENGKLPEMEVLSAGEYEGDVKGGDLGLGLGRYGMPFNIRVTQEEIESIRHTHSELITAGRKRVMQAKQKQSDRSIPRLLFLEGFLLYPRPDGTTSKAPPPRVNNSNIDDEEHCFRYQVAVEKATKEDKLHTKILTNLALKLSKGEMLEDRQMDLVQEHHYLSLNRAFHELSSLLDIKLFLPTSRDIAKMRRMERPEYVDESNGGTRKPGQMWKTEGYFEDVAWMHHVIEHQWIVDWNGVPKQTTESREMARKCGVVVSEEIDASLPDTVFWAVGIILDHLKCSG